MLHIIMIARLEAAGTVMVGRADQTGATSRGTAARSLASSVQSVQGRMLAARYTAVMGVWFVDGSSREQARSCQFFGCGLGTGPESLDTSNFWSMTLSMPLELLQALRTSFEILGA